jgi:hypothetical protein
VLLPVHGVVSGALCALNSAQRSLGQTDWEPGRDQEGTPRCTRPTSDYAGLGLVRRPSLIFRQGAERRPGRYFEARCLASTPSCPWATTAS